MTWEDYEYGRTPRHGSEESLASRVQFDAATSPPVTSRFPNANRDGLNGPEQGDLHDLHHRRCVQLKPSQYTFPSIDLPESHANDVVRCFRSSLSMRINSITQVGGVNSLENFARSWSRAAGFPEIPTRRPSFILSPDDEEIGRKSEEPTSPAEHRSLLSQQLEQQGASSDVFEDEETPHVEDEDASQIGELSKTTSAGSNDVLERAPYLASPFASSYGGIYGSLSSHVNDSSMRQAGEMYRRQQAQGHQEPGKETEPLLVKVVEQKDGHRVQYVVGQSTLPQTVFNSVNVLIGVGLLSLPLGLKYSGWLIGMLFLFFAAITTRYTAGILAKCLDKDPSMIGFADIAWTAFGARGSLATGFLFTIELLAACVALVVLFADSLDALIPGWGVVAWKIVAGIVLIPLSFVPLRYLSFTSVLGIICCLGSGSMSYQACDHANRCTVVVLIFVDGILKPHFPGSLRDPAPMAGLLPQRWSTIPLSFGLLMCKDPHRKEELRS